MKDTTKTEWCFDNEKFMEAIRSCHSKGKHASLRDLTSITGINISTLSRISNGQPLDMSTFLTVCSKLNLVPGDYFTRWTWKLVQE